MNQAELFEDEDEDLDLPREPAAPLAHGWTVKVFGMGGVGSIVGRYLFIYLNSVGTEGRLVFGDADDFESKNASRMLFATPGNKAAVIVEDLRPHARDSNLALVAVEEYRTEDNLERLISEDDIVILAVDNHATRKLVNDFCATKRKNVCLISGGNEGAGADSTGVVQRGTYGNVQIYLSRDGIDVTPPLTEFHPEIENPADVIPTEISCTEALISTPQILFANLAVASSMLNAFWLQLCGALHYPELCFDIHHGRMQPMPLPSGLAPR